jgi:putative ABC transport system ATP-binding protein
MILQAKNVVKTFHQASSSVEVLKEVNLELQEAETLAIVGQSGSGKSTLLSLLAGLDKPTHGEVRWQDKEIGKISERDLTLLRARQMGIIFQQFHLMSNLTALENVGLPLEIAREPETVSRALKALEQVGLGARAKHFPHELSGGEKQRVAIARAIVMRPKLLLADEPSGSLDTHTGDQVMKLLFDLVSTQKMSMILVTHNQELVKKCSRTLVLREGRLV